MESNNHDLETIPTALISFNSCPQHREQTLHRRENEPSAVQSSLTKITAPHHFCHLQHAQLRLEKAEVEAAAAAAAGKAAAGRTSAAAASGDP